MTDALEKRLLANEAQEMLGKEGAFAKAVLQVRKRLFNALLSAPVNSLEAAELHAQLKLLPAIADELQALITDYNFSKQRGQA